MFFSLIQIATSVSPLSSLLSPLYTKVNKEQSDSISVIVFVFSSRKSILLFLLPWNNASLLFLDHFFHSTMSSPDII